MRPPETGPLWGDTPRLLRRARADAALMHHEQFPDSRPLLDEAVARNREALADLDPSAPEAAQLHRVLGELAVDRYLGTADHESLADIDDAVAHFRAGLAALGAGADAPAAGTDGGTDPSLPRLLHFWLGSGLMLLGRCRKQSEPLYGALDAFAAVLGRPERPTGLPLSEQPWWTRESLALSATCRLLLWAVHLDPDQVAPGAVELERLLADPDGLGLLFPEDLVGHGMMLYEQAAGCDDDTLREHAIGLLRRAVDERRPDTEDILPSIALLLIQLQQDRNLRDPAPERLRTIVACAEYLLGRPDTDLDPSDRPVVRLLLLSAQLQLGDVVLEELEQETLRSHAADLDALLSYDGNEDAVATTADYGDFRSTPIGATLRDTLGRDRLKEMFDRHYDRWLAMDPADKHYGLMAGLLLSRIHWTDMDGLHVTPAQREALLEAALAHSGEANWQARMLTTDVLARMKEGYARGTGLDEAVHRMDRALAVVREDPALRDTVEFARAIATASRAQLAGAADELDAAIATWRRLRGKVPWSDRQTILIEHQFAYLAGVRAVQRKDLAEADDCLSALVDGCSRLDPLDVKWVEVWCQIEMLWSRRNLLAEDLHVPPAPPPARRPTVEEVRRGALRLTRNGQAQVLGNAGAVRVWPALDAEDLKAHDEAVSLLQEGFELSVEGGENWRTFGLGLAIGDCRRGRLEQDLPRFNRGVDLLERIQQSLEGPEHRLWAAVGNILGSAYRLRAKTYRTGPEQGDRRLSRRVGLAALRGHAWTVLLQSGTGYATETTAKATAAALEVAGWCLEDEKPAEALQALDAGRALVLHSAVTSQSLPERLEAAGCAELAAEWRAAESGDTAPVGGADPADTTDDAPEPPEPGPTSELRRRVLAALTGPDRARRSLGGLLDPPTAEEVGAALRAVGADALAYLVPADEDRGGTAVLVTADGRARAVPLPLLREEAGPLRDYRPVPAAGRDLGPVPEADGDSGPHPLRAQLDRLCAWAWYAAVKPLLAAVPVTAAGPKLVLVPMGGLAAVPWHAAWEAGPEGARGYAVERAEISYAASARLLCEVAARPPLPRTGTALIVGDPTGDLRFAGEEARAVQHSFYPHGRFLDREATPERVLSWMDDPASAGGVLHLACHGTVADRQRHTAYLSLSGGDLAAEALTEQRGAEERRPALVVLAACRSHVSGRGHDEAYSLATAFLAVGADSVLGSLWPVPDEATSLLMYMAHHYLRREGESPARALRRAQLWMLDRERGLPPDMPEALALRAGAVDPDDLSAWAGFTHLGR